MREDAAHVVRDRAHYEAVEERDLPLGPGAGDDPSGRKKTEIAHRGVKPLGPVGRVLLGRGASLRDAAPGILDRAIDRLAGGALQPVLHVPDLLRDRGDGGHLRVLQGSASPLCQCWRFSAIAVPDLLPLTVIARRAATKQSQSVYERRREIASLRSQ